MLNPPPPPCNGDGGPGGADRMGSDGGPLRSEEVIMTTSPPGEGATVYQMPGLPR